MKYSIALKFIALMLCALCVVSAVACGIGLVFMEAYDLYDQPLDTYRESQLDSIASELAWRFTQRQAAESLSNCSMDIIDELYGSCYVGGLLADRYAVDIYEGSQLVANIGDSGLFSGTPRVYELKTTYPIVTSEYYVDESGKYYENEAATEPPTADATAASYDATEDPLARVEGQTPVYSSEHYDQDWDEYGNWYSVTHTLDYYQGPEYTANVYLDEDGVLGLDYALISVMYAYQRYFIPGILVSLLVFAVTLVYLCTVAGRNRSGQIHLAAINRIPIDLYALIACGGIVLLVLPVTFVIEAYYSYNELSGNIQLCILICGLCGFGIALLALGFIYAFAAQVKASDRYWWRHSICGWCLGLIGKVLRWVGHGLSLFGKGCRAVFIMLPVIWQWLLTAVLMVLGTLLLLFLAVDGYGYFQLFWILLFLAALAADVAIICYGGWCFGMLLKGTKIMSQGHLEHKINTKFLYGSFKDFALQLNSLAGAAEIAAERQMKSERMKTELITNVSHDIKTPLTSIINYVDLMKKPHSEADGQQYLEVLDRQSQRLKKLIDDLMEMSKASTGNLTVELGNVDAVEAINQALGEFSDKLDQVGLTPVFRHPEFPVTMTADGRLVWRVLSNILSNAVKYALPDTRLYIDLMVLQGNAVIAIKNISRDQLNVNADELMERFVRGDTSRNTEGSGLGLNIAKSLVELQHGQMHLMVDGDLFKVTLIFPLA